MVTIREEKLSDSPAIRHAIVALLNCRRSDARIAENGSARTSAFNKSSKVVLVQAVRGAAFAIPGAFGAPRGRHDPLVRHIMRLVATDVTGVNPSESSGVHYSQATPRVSRPHHRGWSEPPRATYRNGDFSRGS
jgi:hypothetical protein